MFSLLNDYTPEDLNRVEGKIEELWTLVENINPKINELKNVNVGESLSGKTLYLNFPSINLITEFAWNTTEPYTKTIDCGNGNYIIFQQTTSGGYKGWVHVYYGNVLLYSLYEMENYVILTNEKKFRLPSDFGEVISVNESDPSLQYINFTDIVFKTDWNEMDFPYLDEIDRIKNNLILLTKYFILPYDFQELITGSRLFNFRVANRLEFDLISIEKALEQALIRFSGESYSGDTIWL